MAIKKIFLTVKYRSEEEYQSAAMEALRLCSQMGVEVKISRVSKAGRKTDSEKYFHYKTKEQHKIVKYSNILFFQKDLRKVIIHTTKGVDEFYSSMDKLMNDLDMTNFIIPHGSYIVNKEKMIWINKDKLLVDGSDMEIPISRRYQRYVAGAFARRKRYGAGKK
jgi:DNA-binding LytR/AlgR family response regulator